MEAGTEEHGDTEGKRGAERDCFIHETRTGVLQASSHVLDTLTHMGYRETTCNCVCCALTCMRSYTYAHTHHPLTPSACECMPGVRVSVYARARYNALRDAYTFPQRHSYTGRGFYTQGRGREGDEDAKLRVRAFHSARIDPSFLCGKGHA